MAGLLALGACSSTTQVDRPTPIYQPPPPPPPPVEDPRPVDPEPVIDRQSGLVPPHMRGRDITRAALLLPFSAENGGARAEALQLLNAAQLALFEHGDGQLVLIPKDTGGTAAGARQATDAAIRDGADIILGPLFGSAARAAGEAAQPYSVPVIAFSTDAGAAGNGVYLLSYPPEIEVARVTEYATRRGITRFAYLGPTGRYGRTVSDTLSQQAMLGGGALIAEESYTGGVEAMTSAAARLASLGVVELEALEAFELAAQDWVPSEESPFQAVILPEGGVRLRMLAPLLPYHDVDPLLVKFMGTGLWNDPEIVREPALRGGWFAGPDQAARDRFQASFVAAYDEEPSRIASHAYDAVLLTLHLANGSDGFERRAVETPDGFFGADGLFRFAATGQIERGLAIYEVRSSGLRVIEEAPRSFEPDAF